MADNEFKPQGEEPTTGVAAGDNIDNDYKSRSGQYQIPVQSDDKAVEDPIDPNTADSDAQLRIFSLPFQHNSYDLQADLDFVERDEKDAIDTDNVISSRTRGAAKPSGTYQEPGDEEGMPPASDGTSRLRTG